MTGIPSSSNTRQPLVLAAATSLHHFSDTALATPASCTCVHSLSGLYSFIAPAIREVFSPKFR